MNQNSLSALIEALQAQPSRERFQHLLAAFSHSSVGIMALSVPKEQFGKTFKTEGEEVSLASSQHGDGKSRVLAFADPKEFIANFCQKFNAEMKGEEVFKVVLHNPACGGILLNSASSPISIPIEREDIQRFLQPRQAGGAASERKAAWWKLWS